LKLSRLQEEKLLSKYETLLDGIVESCYTKCPSFSIEDLEQEAAAAFLLIVRELDNPEDIKTRLVDIRREVYRFIVQCFGVSIPYETARKKENSKALYGDLASLDEIGDMLCARTNELDDVLTEALQEQVLETLSEEHRTVFNLLMDGYKRAEIAQMTKMTDRQVRRRIEKIQSVFYDALAHW